jgi:hypothetical protein
MIDGPSESGVMGIWRDERTPDIYEPEEETAVRPFVKPRG